ncbi:MAG: hypothetical protein EXR16_05670 [Bacteroidetes bacterium]|nr:hypothetical protein [Bacteroidota bacterium]
MEIRKEFLKDSLITVNDLCNQFVDSEKSTNVTKERHMIRSVLNNLHKRKEIVRVSLGVYKKSDTMLSVEEMEKKSRVKSIPKKTTKTTKIKHIEPKYDESFD